LPKNDQSNNKNDQSYFSKIEYFSKNYAKMWTKQEQNLLFSNKFSFKVPYFYVIPKIHKWPLKGRPISVGLDTVLKDSFD
jgi:hypothetical protein